MVKGARVLDSNDSIKERILAAAGPVFADRGFDGATIREICAAAEVNVAAVNYHFGDKRQLYLEAVRQAHDCRVAAAPPVALDASKTPEEQIAAYVRAMLHRMLAKDGREPDRWEARLMLREVLRPTEACRELVEDHFRPEFEMLLGILRRLTGDAADEHFLRRLGFSVVGQCLHYRVAGEVAAMLTPDDAPAVEYSAERLAEHITFVTIAACRARANAESSDNLPRRSNESCHRGPASRAPSRDEVHVSE